MESETRTLAFLLCMHRSGSSLTASILQELGISLGPYPLLEASPNNIHGHYESVPLQLLNRKVQEIALGFVDDYPTSQEVMTRLLDGKGSWPDGVKIPDELLDEGRRLIAGLIGSGSISGFKDPRTVLTWPFWRQVVAEFPALRVVAVPLLRSPHEIAMSLCTRSHGELGYWTSLDLVAIHFGRMKAILESANHATKAVRFGSDFFLDDVADAARYCGLSWNEADALRVFDRECVHHEPATVDHEAQILYEVMGGRRPPHHQAERNGWLLARDARKCEALTQRHALQTVESHRRIMDQQLLLLHQSLSLSQQQHLQAQKDLARSQTDRAQSQAEVVQISAELAQSQAELAEARAEVAQAQARLAQVQGALSSSQDHLATVCAELSRAQENERETWEVCQRLREQRDRFESHPVLGHALRARRRVKALLGITPMDTGAR